MIDVAIITEERCLVVDESIRHNAMAIEEDNVLVEAFKKAGYTCKRIGWDEKNVDWSEIKVAIIKTTWNYFDKIIEFRKWLRKVSKHCVLLNSCNMVLWNMDKTYLLELKQMGIDIPKTSLLDDQNKFSPEYWDEQFGNKGIIVKPTISGGAKDTFYLKSPYDKDQMKLVHKAIQSQDMLVQEFLQSIVEIGEVSLVYIDGKFTHGRLKKPKSKDFRVQPYYGGTLDNYQPSPAEIAFGEKLLEACQSIHEIPMYARIDICYGDQGEILLMELEVIEPQLWYPQEPNAVDVLVSGVSRYLV